MKVEGKYSLKASPDRVWDMLMDPQVLSECIPGCQTLEPVGDDTYKARLKVGIAAISGTYDCTIRLFDKNKPSSYKMSVEGSSPAGIVKGEGKFEISESKSGDTDVHVIGDASLGGTLGRVGQRLISPASSLLMKQFFDKLKKKAG